MPWAFVLPVLAQNGRSACVGGLSGPRTHSTVRMSPSEPRAPRTPDPALTHADGIPLTRANPRRRRRSVSSLEVLQSDPWVTLGMGRGVQGCSGCVSGVPRQFPPLTPQDTPQPKPHTGTEAPRHGCHGRGEGGETRAPGPRQRAGAEGRLSCATSTCPSSEASNADVRSARPGPSPRNSRGSTALAASPASSRRSPARRSHAESRCIRSTGRTPPAMTVDQLSARVGACGAAPRQSRRPHTTTP